MTAPAKKSAYPKPLDELIAEVEAWADELGELPSRNQVMARCHVGSRKATEALAALKNTETAPARPAGTVRRLHAVADTDGPDTATDHAADTDTAAEDDNTAETNPEGRIGDGGGEEVSEQIAAGQVTTDDLPSDEDDTEPAEAQPDPTGPNPVTPEAGPVAVGRPVRIRRWALLLLAAPAFVAIWSGWVGLGGLTGFGIVHPLPGIWDGFQLNTAITLPIGVETYAAYALRVWLHPGVPGRARRFAKLSAIGSLALGALGQVAYHLMTAAGYTAAPAWITTLVACLPVAVLGMGAALAHLLHPEETR